MAIDLVAAFTFGQRDLQVLAVDKEGRCRVSPEAERVGVLHRGLLNGLIPYHLWMPQARTDMVPERKDVKARWNGSAVELTGAGCRLAGAADLEITGKQGGVWIIPGLLWKELLALQNEVRLGRCHLRRVMLFHTDRGPSDERAQQEPVAAAPIIVRWLRENIPGATDAVVSLVPVLQPGEDLLVKDELGNSLLQPAAAQRH